MTLPALLDVARDLPGVEEGLLFGSPTIKIGKTSLFYWSPRHDCPVFRVDFEERAFLIEVDPETFFTTKYYRKWPCVLARPDKVDIGWVRENLRRAWRAQAPKTLLKAHAEV